MQLAAARLAYSTPAHAHGPAPREWHDLLLEDGVDHDDAVLEGNFAPLIRRPVNVNVLQPSGAKSRQVSTSRQAAGKTGKDVWPTRYYRSTQRCTRTDF
eukprot:99917-Chlamydomonas_euryale.AAC.4